MKHPQNLLRIFRAITTPAFLLMIVLTAFAQERIKYNAVYDCGSGKVSIKVLSCDGTARSAKCKVFYINKYAPGGGHTDEVQRSFIEDHFVGQCSVQGGADDRDGEQGADEQTRPQRQPDRVNGAGRTNAGQFKVGDRVQVSTGGLKDDKYYQPCTIIRGLDSNAYGVGCDPWRGQPYMEYSVLPNWVRAWPGAPAATFAVDKLRVDANNTVLADREILDCRGLQHNGRNGSAPPADLARKLIRCLYERPSQTGQDGATIVDITDLAIGAPHRWRLYEDIGQGTASTLVYPIRVKWNMETFYRTRNLKVTGKESMFTCFVDKTGLWQCGSSAGQQKEGTVQEIPVKR